jgi:hypothetical protein
MLLPDACREYWRIAAADDEDVEKDIVVMEVTSTMKQRFTKRRRRKATN